MPGWRRRRALCAREWPRFSTTRSPRMPGRRYVELAGGDAAVRRRRLTEPRLARHDRAGLCPLRSRRGDAARSSSTPIWLLELFHGPTLAFKDVALQLLGLLFEEFLLAPRRAPDDRRRDSAATPAARRSTPSPGATDRHLHAPPQGRVSDVQRRQMTTVKAPNVHNIAIEGSFDDAQAMVKRDVRRHGDDRALPFQRRSIRSTGRG